MVEQAIAHENQTLKDHLQSVANLSRKNAEKIGCPDYGELLGLLHDLGKYSESFQNYIKSAIGVLDPDVDGDFVDAKEQKGKIDHSTAGAQFLWAKLSSKSSSERVLAQILSLCLVSHHSGLIDCLTTDINGTYDAFTKRIMKNNERTHLTEVELKMENEITEKINLLLSNSDFRLSIERILKSIFESVQERNQLSITFQFHLGLLTRFFFSCLIDADRQDSADSQNLEKSKKRQNGVYQSWSILSERLEEKVNEFGKPETNVNKARAEISNQCLKASKKEKGIFTLTVPTGGGKTLASLRFALNHAEEHHLDRILYIVPFTTIIDQNAKEVRKILEKMENEKGRIVLENHSNIGSEQQTWKEKILTENWDAPIVYTTMVQLLEAFFGGGTRGARRLHQLARSVIVFDEIQNLPVRCVHMFCNAINFIVKQCGSTVILCTATQPLLGNVNPVKGALNLCADNEIVSDVQKLYKDLERVSVQDSRKLGGYSDDEISELAISETEKNGSCLIIVNTKRSARSLLINIQAKTKIECFHLSTSMCPVHRKKILDVICERINPEKNLPTICVSTQLIEAGVDIDFASVIRYEAGLDSIAQAAGRCNRNGIRENGNVYIVNPTEESIDCLKEIAIGKSKTQRVLEDFKANPNQYKNNMIGPDMIEWYYKNYFFEREKDMSYPISASESYRNDTLLDLLSTNELARAEYRRVHNTDPRLNFYQSFMKAGEIFKSIDAPTKTVIVQYGKAGENLVTNLCAASELEKQYKILHEAQQYSVNIFPYEFEKLEKAGAILRVQKDMQIFYLDAKYYSEQFGVSMEIVNKEETLNV